MISTRQRKKRINYAKYVLPILAISFAIFAITWMPSRTFLAKTPLKSVVQITTPLINAVNKHLRLSSTENNLTVGNAKIQDLHNQLEIVQEQKRLQALHIQQLEAQISSLQHQSLISQASPQPVSSNKPNFGASFINDINQPTAQERQLAGALSAMEPDKAAAIVVKLPQDQVVRVLHAMDTDSAGNILAALPTNKAAQLSEKMAQVPQTTNR
jgi:flagellar motility protein MotE (MotC chaperone)